MKKSLAILLVAAGCVTSAWAQDFDKVNVVTTKVAEGVYMLEGGGGNLGVGVGADAVFVIDDDYAQLTPRIKAAIAALTDKPVRFILNTHWHGDHTGGNQNFAQSGALVVAHDNVRKRMSAEHFFEMFNEKVPASPQAALPIVTFAEAVTFHINGDTLHAFHVAPAHTDGDAVVHFRKANVIHMGDLYFASSYPFIDLSSGGSVKGMIAGADRVLALADDNTKIIPGHGPLSDKKALKRYRDMLAAIHDRIDAMIKAGKSLKEIVAAKPTAEFDAVWGKGFMKPDLFVEIFYRDLKGK